MSAFLIKPGDCFFNVARFSCLRVKHISGVFAHYITWRPDGSRQTTVGNIHIDKLRKSPYWRMEAVRIYANGKSFEWDLLTPEPKPAEVEP